MMVERMRTILHTASDISATFLGRKELLGRLDGETGNVGATEGRMKKLSEHHFNDRSLRGEWGHIRGRG